MATKVVLKQQEPEQAEQLPDATVQLEESAKLLLGLLDERERFLIEQTCEGQQLNQWMYIAGILKRALDTGEHTLPTVDPLWRSWTGGWQTPIVPKQTCPVCTQVFTPQWRGQIYDRTECGAAASRVALASVDTSGRFVPSAIGDEPAEMLKSTIRDSDAGYVPTIAEALDAAQQGLDAAVAERVTARGLGKNSSSQ